MVACSTDDEDAKQTNYGTLTLTSSINGFESDGITRTNLEGTAFADGDRIKLKIICPYTSTTQTGESTWGNSFDSFWLLKWSGGAWTTMGSSDKVDISAHYSYGSNNIFGLYEAQNTPYVYTASTWNENVLFMANGSRYSAYSYIFQANQSEQADYLKSDLLWAQTYMQTGSYNVHLSFNHVMACLKMTLTGVTLSDNTVVTLEGMPDIDQQEVVVGDYYAAASKSYSTYGYKDKCSCTKANNGNVLGIAVINDTYKKAYVYRMEGNPSDDNSSNKEHGPVANTGVYTAYNAAKSNGNNVYYLIVPPCELTTAPKLWIRDGANRYNCDLYLTPTGTNTQSLKFEQGKQYNVNITISQ